MWTICFLKSKGLDLDVNSLAMIRASDVQTWSFIQIIETLQILVNELATRQNGTSASSEPWIHVQEEGYSARYESTNRSPPGVGHNQAQYPEIPPGFGPNQGQYTQCRGKCMICQDRCIRILEEDPNHRHCRCRAHRRR